MIISFFSPSYFSRARGLRLNYLLCQTIISGFNLIFITPQSYFNYGRYRGAAAELYSPARTLPSANIVLRAIEGGG